MVEPTKFKIEDIHDAYGFSPLDSFIQTSFGGAYDYQRMVYKKEIADLEIELDPDGPSIQERTIEDKGLLNVIDGAKTKFGEHIEKAVEKVPQPTWLNNPEEYKLVENYFLDQASLAAFNRPYVEGDGSKLDRTINTYNVRSQIPGHVQADRVADVARQANRERQSYVKGLVAKMDGHAAEVDKTCEEVRKLAITPEDAKNFVQQGVKSLDDIQAIYPGYFQPADGSKYNKYNMAHILEAAEFCVKNPALAKAMDMQVFSSREMNEIREIAKLRNNSELGYQANTSQFGNKSSAAQRDLPPSPSSQPVDENNEHDVRSMAHKRQQMRLTNPLLG